MVPVPIYTVWSNIADESDPDTFSAVEIWVEVTFFGISKSSDQIIVIFILKLTRSGRLSPEMRHLPILVILGA